MAGEKMDSDKLENQQATYRIPAKDIVDDVVAFFRSSVMML